MTNPRPKAVPVRTKREVDAAANGNGLKASTSAGTSADPVSDYPALNNGSAVETMRGDTLSRAERRQLLAKEQGSPFDPWQQLFVSFDNGVVFNYDSAIAADYRSMLSRSGKAKSLEQVLTLPIRGADWKITAAEGDTGQCQLVQDNLHDKLDLVIDQMTSAISYARAFFEVSWTTNDLGQVIYSDIAHRPATGCEAGFDPRTGRARGFRQRIVPVAGYWPGPFAASAQSSTPGYVIVRANRAFVYTHGVYRDPINGLSDLDVALWCHTTAQKILFLWCQYLESQALPKTVIYGDDDTQAQQRAAQLQELKSSGVLGIARDGGINQRSFDVLESSGKGADQFLSAIQYLESSMVNSVLAGFTELPTAARGGMGSYALSADQSEFFLQSRQAVADEIADSIRRDLFGPLVAYNYGTDAPLPKIEIGPLSTKTAEAALNMLTAVVAAPQLNVPRTFVDQLTQSVSGLLGLDPIQVRQAIEQDVIDRTEQAKAMADQARLDQTLQAAAGVADSPGAAGESKGPVAGLVGPTAASSGAVTPPLPPRLPDGARTIGAAVDVAADLISAQLEL